ncbi:MAG: response regulator, partial [Gammaproteobacteria bacterium]|nr:response regulator [Gammaproteobacteria bacterium]
PLNAIVGFGQILELSDLSQRDKESAAHIVKAGRHLTDMINEILDIARIESGHYELSPEPVLVREVLLETWGLVQPLADRQNIKLLQEIPKSCRDSVFVDRQRLKQVFLNLMSNAIKYNHENGYVSLFCSAQPEGIIRISIKDSGPGIAADNLARVFEPFVRLGGDKDNTEGSGIGLALSKVLVEAMGGSLGVDSETGAGSTFWIEFPLHQDATGIEAAPEADTVYESTLEIEQLNTTTILYIEDDRVNIKLVEAILGELEGIELKTATEGGPGYNLAVKLHPDLILLDSQLPDISGYDVLNKLKSHPDTRTIPVIIISADATEKQIEKLKSAGAYAYLTKPFNINELLQTVEAAINHE